MLSDDTLLLLNRATLASHTLRTAVHELNNILQMVSGYAELLQGAPDLPPQAARRVDAILRQTGRGQAILQAVTEVTRGTEQGPGRVAVARAVERVLESRRYEHTRAGLTVTVESGDGEARVPMPSPHLEQILLNLVLNAEQAVAGAPAASLAIDIGGSADVVEVLVRDSGPGPARGVDPFAPFATSRPGAAAGLGLPASRLLAERYGGSLSAFTSGTGHGWRLRLPASS